MCYQTEADAEEREQLHKQLRIGRAAGGVAKARKYSGNNETMSKTDSKGRVACDRRSQRVNQGLFRVCSRRPSSLEETGPDQIAPAAWLNGLSKRKGKPQLEGKGKYTVAGESLGSVVGVRKGSCCRRSMCVYAQAKEDG